MQFEAQWRINGHHYQRTLEAWLANLDERRTQALEIMARVYGSAQSAMRLQRWRLFLLACSGLFGYGGGNEWYVSHYRFRQRNDVTARH